MKVGIVGAGSAGSGATGARLCLTARACYIRCDASGVITRSRLPDAVAEAETVEGARHGQLDDLGSRPGPHHH